jgi:hypothetical protein
MIQEPDDNAIATEQPIPASITTSFHYAFGSHGRKRMTAGHATPTAQDRSPGRVPRVARLMALAIRFERLIREGAVARQVDLAEVGHVTRARVTQIMNLLHLAPDIQEAILFLPLVESGKDPIGEHHLRRLVSIIEWDQQRAAWRAIADLNKPDPTPHADVTGEVGATRKCLS